MHWVLGVTNPNHDSPSHAAEPLPESELETLDPKIDIVFKMLFAAKKNERLLVSFLNAVLQPERPIVRVEVSNPEIEPEQVDRRGAFLDVHVWREDGEQVDIEMQTTGHPGLLSRFLYYWAGLYREQLKKGQSYEELKPVIGVFILNFKQLPSESFHSHYQVRNAEGHVLSSALGMHFLELPKLQHTLEEIDGAEATGTEEAGEMGRRAKRGLPVAASGRSCYTGVASWPPPPTKNGGNSPRWTPTFTTPMNPSPSSLPTPKRAASLASARTPY